MGVLFGIIASFALFVFWGGYVAATLWGWFVVPLGVMAISYWHAVGLTCVMAAFAGVKSDEDTEDSESIGEGVAKATFKGALIPALLLGMGWVAHNYMPAPQQATYPSFPGIPGEVVGAMVDHAEKTMDELESAGTRYVAENVICENGIALVALRGRGSFETLSFIPVTGVRNAGPETTVEEPLSCEQHGIYKSNGKQLSSVAVAMLATQSIEEHGKVR